MTIDIAKLKAAALAAGGGEWRTSYIPPYGRHYVVSTDGRTVVNLSEGDVPARYATFIATANPASVLELIAQNEAMVAAHVNLKLLADTYRQAYEEARARIAELETRKVTLKLPRYSFFDFREGSPYQSGAYCNLEALINECKKAGINLETGGE